MKPFLIIAIDGPSGVGKSTVAHAVAQALHLRHVDTGVMYRAVAWAARRRGVAFDDETALGQLASDLMLELREGRVLVDGEDVTRVLRTDEMDQAASAVARLVPVRVALVARQRAMGSSGGVVMEGRDIGTVVFPDADVKIFLDASPEERARRRAQDAAHAKRHHSVSRIAAELETRDRQDSTRAASPLSRAADAVVVDTTLLGIAEVVSRVLALVYAGRAGR